MIVINTIIIFGGTHAEHIPTVKNQKPEQPGETEKNEFPDHIYFASYLYQ